MCEKNNKFDTPIFQVLPDSCIGIKPPLLSGRDSERRRLIRVQADEIQSLCSSADDTASTKHDDLPGFYFTTQVDASTQYHAKTKGTLRHATTFSNYTRPQAAHTIPRHHLLPLLLFLQTVDSHHQAGCKWRTSYSNMLTRSRA